MVSGGGVVVNVFVPIVQDMYGSSIFWSKYGPLMKASG